MVKKNIKSLCAVFFVSVLVFSFSFGFVSRAEVEKIDNRFYVPYSEPTCNENSGYISLEILQTSTNKTYLATFFWYLGPYSETTSSKQYMELEVALNGTSIQFRPYVIGSPLCFYSISLYNTSGKVELVGSGLSSSNQDTRSVNLGGSIVGIAYGGNCSVSFNSVANNYVPNIQWGDSPSGVQIYGLLKDLNNGLITQNQYISGANSILSDIKSDVEDIKSETKESNTWLEKIFNYLDGSREEEKEGAQTQGDNSVSEGSSAISDNSGGFVDAMGSLASTLSATGTYCVWEFPRIYIPAIPGVIGETELISQQSIDFNFWINKIPANILLVVQSLCTAGLIIYCFKELYSTISYVLTMRKDDGS